MMARGRKSEPGDTRVSPNGYHYTRTETKWELTGRLVAGETLGRELLKTERIRYEDNNRLNNDPDNIIVYEVAVGSNGKRRARLEARLEEIQAELDMLDEEEDEGN